MATSEAPRPDFRPGDKVRYGTLRGTVVQNHGSYGDVRMDNGRLVSWRWVLDEEVTRVANDSD